MSRPSRAAASGRSGSAMTPTRVARFALPAASLLAAVAMTACAPTVGDTCTTNSECGSELTCDLATPEGYCTVTPCRPGECPPEAACVDFGAEATYCMRVCRDPDEGCRDGLTCRTDLTEANPDLGGKGFCGVAP